MKRTSILLAILLALLLVLAAAVIAAVFSSRQAARQAELKQINDALSAGAAALQNDRSRGILDSLNNSLQSELQSQAAAKAGFEQTLDAARK